MSWRVFYIMTIFWRHCVSQVMTNILASWRVFDFMKKLLHHDMFLTSWRTFWCHEQFLDVMTCLSRHDKLLSPKYTEVVRPFTDIYILLENVISKVLSMVVNKWCRKRSRGLFILGFRSNDVFLTSRQVFDVTSSFWRHVNFLRHVNLFTSWQTFWRHDEIFDVMLNFLVSCQLFVIVTNFLSLKFKMVATDHFKIYLFNGLDYNAAQYIVYGTFGVKVFIFVVNLTYFWPSNPRWPPIVISEFYCHIMLMSNTYWCNRP